VGVARHKRRIAQLLDGQEPDGGFGVGPYSKWKGAHWRLISLVELGIWGATGHRYWRRETDVVDWGDAHEMVTPIATELLA
jgi:hypothetical protein